jgi:hypothetical protein
MKNIINCRYIIILIALGALNACGSSSSNDGFVPNVALSHTTGDHTGTDTQLLISTTATSGTITVSSAHHDNGGDPITATVSGAGDYYFDLTMSRTSGKLNLYDGDEIAVELTNATSGNGSINISFTSKKHILDDGSLVGTSGQLAWLDGGGYIDAYTGNFALETNHQEAQRDGSVDPSPSGGPYKKFTPSLNYRVLWFFGPINPTPEWSEGVLRFQIKMPNTNNYMRHYYYDGISSTTPSAGELEKWNGSTFDWEVLDAAETYAEWGSYRRHLSTVINVAGLERLFCFKTGLPADYTFFAYDDVFVEY